MHKIRKMIAFPLKYGVSKNKYPQKWKEQEINKLLISLDS